MFHVSNVSVRRGRTRDCHRSLAFSSRMERTASHAGMLNGQVGWVCCVLDSPSASAITTKVAPIQPSNGICNCATSQPTIQPFVYELILGPTDRPTSRPLRFPSIFLNVNRRWESLRCLVSQGGRQNKCAENTHPHSFPLFLLDTSEMNPPLKTPIRPPISSPYESRILPAVPSHLLLS